MILTSIKITLALLLLASFQSVSSAQRAARRTPAPAGINLTAQDMALLVDGLGLSGEVRKQLTASAEERKAFAKNVREMLAAAEESKSKGLAARPDVKLQMELSRAFVIAQTYFKKREAAGATAPEQIVSPEEIEALFRVPGREADFNLFVEDYRKNGPNRGAAVTDAQRADLRKHWGRVMVGKNKGVAEGIDRERKTQLVVMLQQARLLAGAYAQELRPRFKATEQEIEAYLAAHPELDTKAARAKAEEVLRRARAGEDFVALAREFSADRGNKQLGGELGWFGRGVMVREFEDAAFLLKPGEVGGVVETQFGFHIIKVDERRTQAGIEGKPEDQVRARHILILYNATPPKSGVPPKHPREQAREVVEQEKETRALVEFIARWRVRVAEDYPVGASPAASTQPAAAREGAQAGKTGAQSPATKGRAKGARGAATSRTKQRP